MQELASKIGGLEDGLWMKEEDIGVRNFMETAAMQTTRRSAQ